MVRIRPGEPLFSTSSLAARPRRVKVAVMARLSPFLSAAALALMAAACGDSEPPGPGERISLSAEDLGRAYADSEPAAQKRYGNRRLRVTGVITGMGIDVSDNFVLRMKGPDPLIDVHLTIADEARAEAETVKRGTKLTLLCEGATEVLGSPTLDGCTFETPADGPGNGVAGRT